MTEQPHELTCDECKEVKQRSSLGAPLKGAQETVNRKWYQHRKKQSTVVCFWSAGLPRPSLQTMWTVEQHITLIHEVTATPLTTRE